MKKKFLIRCECGSKWQVSDDSGYAVCPTFGHRPEGEPEVWDGNIWYGPLKRNLVSIALSQREVSA